jgi:hypothetical protein
MNRLTLWSCCALLSLWGCASNTTSAKSSDWVYELRTYTANEGKLDALHARFRDHTLTLFERHGMRNVAYWTPSDPPDRLIYIVAHASKGAATASWKAFVADPEWQAVYAASIEDGRLVANIESVFMRPTDYSPILSIN